MKTIHAALVFSCMASAAVVFAASDAPLPAPKSTPANPLSQRFKQVRDRIGVLFEHRNEAPAPFEPRNNPFRTPGVAPVPGAATPSPSGTEGEPKPPPPTESNLSILQQAVGQLKVNGVFEIAGRSHLVINARPYKEGDAVQTIVAGETVYLRVKEIEKRSVTLVLNDAEMTLKF